MNPLTNMKNLNKMNDREIKSGIAGDDNRSWHSKYKDSAWVYIGGLPYQLTEGDVICVFSQYGEPVNINLVRDRKTGKSKGFCFLCYEDQRSTNLAVDNFNGTKICGRIIRVDHVEEYKVPMLRDDIDPETKRIYEEGCAPKPIYVPGDSDGQDSDHSEYDMKDKEKLPKEVTNDVLPLQKDDDWKAIKKARKEIRKEEKRKRKEDRRKRREEREFERDRGDPNADRWSQRPLEDDHDVKPIKGTSSFFKQPKKEKDNTGDKKHEVDYDDNLEHQVHMTHFTKDYLAKRYKGADHQTESDRLEQEIIKMEYNRKKKLGETAIFKSSTYVPKRFGKK